MCVDTLTPRLHEQQKSVRFLLPVRFLPGRLSDFCKHFYPHLHETQNRTHYLENTKTLITISLKTQIHLE